MEGKNKLYFGDNLNILRDYVEDASVDLIYLDPPFNSSATYNVLFNEKSGGRNGQEDRAVPNGSARRNKEAGPMNRQGRKERTS
jgi:16S rRNA G966 N2-methylase RsmD